MSAQPSDSALEHQDEDEQRNGLISASPDNMSEASDDDEGGEEGGKSNGNGDALKENGKEVEESDEEVATDEIGRAHV